MITVLCTNLLDGATYAAPQGNPQRRSFKNVQVADLLRVLHDDMLVRRRVLLEMRHGLEELVVLTSVPADRSYSGGPNQCLYQAIPDAHQRGNFFDAAISHSASSWVMPWA